jgi:acyl carrier protein
MQVSEQKVREVLAENASGLEDVNAIGSDDALSDHGVDSLDMYTTIAEIQELTGIEPEDNEFNQLTTINAISTFFSRGE